MSRQYSVVEPHPTPSTSYLPTGRGGAGNIVKSSNISNGKNAVGPASRVPLTQRRPSNTFISGRGGLGNVHPASERAIFSFDEELERQLKFERDLAPVYHTGRGGSGNSVVVDTVGRQSGERRPSEAASVRSTGSAESGADAMNRNVRRGLEKGWTKITGRF
ncbi:hypothetical protein UCRPC4_g01118 [Phaeomoniella chlamydospora]|uniref:Uncharacterized protein n=1 Tax=Phaeomoniella chlamydospora TaxID=158046 RepID=A0A0G2GVP0_PHACM|nr:hypothetical protein UCRPC4_g01118 [Phaeomoniella chlamydospora]